MSNDNSTMTMHHSSPVVVATPCCNENVENSSTIIMSNYNSSPVVVAFSPTANVENSIVTMHYGNTHPAVVATSPNVNVENHTITMSNNDASPDVGESSGDEASRRFDLTIEPIVDPAIDVHLRIANCLHESGSDSETPILINPRYHTSCNYVVVFCSGYEWCQVITKKEYSAFMGSDMAFPICWQYAYAIPVLEALNSFCEELDTYEHQCGHVRNWIYSLALAHVLLQVENVHFAPGLPTIKAKLRRALIFSCHFLPSDVQK